MTPDQYRREGAEAMRKAALEACEDYAPERNVDFPTDPFIAQITQVTHSMDRIRAIDVDKVMSGIPTAPDAVAQLVEAARAIGTLPEGYCFCSTNRIGDDSKAHEPECADLRAALVKMETEQCQISIGPATGATINGLHGSGAGAPDAVDNSHTDAVEQLVSNADRFLPVFLATFARNVDFDGPWDDFDLSGGLRAVIAAMEKPQ